MPLLHLGALALCAVAGSLYFLNDNGHADANVHAPPANSRSILETCASLNSVPGVPGDYAESRIESDRFEHGTPAIWLRNASIWTGNPAEPVIHGGDVLLARGLIKFVGTSGLLTRSKVASLLRESAELDAKPHLDDLKIVEANGAWVTPGIVDVHSHIGVDSAPSLEGSDDTNSVNGITQPWLRTIDAINTHDIAYELTLSGGVTTALVIPGSAGSIGGQGFTYEAYAFTFGELY